MKNSIETEKSERGKIDYLNGNLHVVRNRTWWTIAITLSVRFYLFPLLLLLLLVCSISISFRLFLLGRVQSCLCVSSAYISVTNYFMTNVSFQWEGTSKETNRNYKFFIFPLKIEILKEQLAFEWTTTSRNDMQKIWGNKQWPKSAKIDKEGKEVFRLCPFDEWNSEQSQEKKNISSVFIRHTKSNEIDRCTEHRKNTIFIRWDLLLFAQH